MRRLYVLCLWCPPGRLNLLGLLYRSSSGGSFTCGEYLPNTVAPGLAVADSMPCLPVPGDKATRGLMERKLGAVREETAAADAASCWKWGGRDEGTWGILAPGDNFVPGTWPPALATDLRMFSSAWVAALIISVGTRERAVVSADCLCFTSCWTLLWPALLADNPLMTFPYTLAVWGTVRDVVASCIGYTAPSAECRSREL